MAMSRIRRQFLPSHGITDSSDEKKRFAFELSEAENVVFTERDSIEMTKGFGFISNLMSSNGVISIRRIGRRIFAFSPQKVFSMNPDYSLKEIGSYLNADITSENTFQNYTDVFSPDLFIAGGFAHLVFEQERQIYHTIFNLKDEFISQKPRLISQSSIGGVEPRIISSLSKQYIVYLSPLKTNLYIFNEEEDSTLLVKTSSDTISNFDIRALSSVIFIDYELTNTSNVSTHHTFQFSTERDTVISGSDVINTVQTNYNNIKGLNTIAGTTLWRMNRWCDFTFNGEDYSVLWNNFRGYFIVDSINNIVGKFLGKVAPPINKDGVSFRGNPQIVDSEDSEFFTVYIPALKQSLQVQQDQDTISNPLGLDLIKININKKRLIVKAIDTKNITAISGGIIKQVDSDNLLELGFSESPEIESEFNPDSANNILDVEDLDAIASGGTGNKTAVVSINSNEIDANGIKVPQLIDGEHTLTTLEKVGSTGVLSLSSSKVITTSDEVIDTALNSINYFILLKDSNSFDVEVRDRSNDSLVRTINLEQSSGSLDITYTSVAAAENEVFVTGFYGSTIHKLFKYRLPGGSFLDDLTMNEKKVVATDGDFIYLMPASVGGNTIIEKRGIDFSVIPGDNTNFNRVGTSLNASSLTVRNSEFFFPDSTPGTPAIPAVLGTPEVPAVPSSPATEGSPASYGTPSYSQINLSSNNSNPQGIDIVPGQSQSSTLFMVGFSNEALYTLNTSTGAATRVGNSTRFGVTEYTPTGLASHNGTLYMVGFSTDALYTLNTSTGAATRVGNSSNFGVSEDQPNCLASHNGTLYMTGWRNEALYTLNTSTGAATRVGNSTRFGVNEGSPTGLASHNGTLYIVGESNDALYILNPTTGIATRVGNSTRFGVNEGNPTGLASHNGTLFMVGINNDALYTLNTTTGVATQVGNATNFGANESRPSGLASFSSSIPTGFYIPDLGGNVLYRSNSLNPSSNSDWSTVSLHSGNTSPTAVSIDSNELYVLDSFDKQIYKSTSLNPSSNNNWSRINIHSSSTTAKGLSVANNFIYYIDGLNTLYRGSSTTPPTTNDDWSSLAIHSAISNPGGLKVTSSHIYVVDSDNNTIYRSTTLTPTSDNDWEIIGLSSSINSPQGITIYNDEIYVVDDSSDKIFKADEPTAVVTPAVPGSPATEGVPAIPAVPGTPEVPAVTSAYNGLYKVASNTLTLESFLDAANARPLGLGSYENVLAVLNAPASGQTNTNLYLYDVPGDPNLRIGISTRTNVPPGRTDFVNLRFSQGATEIINQAVSNSSPTSSTNNNERFYDIPMSQALESLDYTLNVEFNDPLSNRWSVSNLDYSFVYENENYKILALEAFESGTKIHLNVTFESVPNRALGFHIRLSEIGSSDASTFVDTSSVGNVYTFVSTEQASAVGFTDGMDERLNFEVRSGRSPGDVQISAGSQIVTYFAVYKWTDADGKSQYSKISNLKTITINNGRIGEGNNPISVPITFSHLNLTGKDDVVVQIYRSTFAASTLVQSIFQKVGEIASIRVGDTDTFLDNVAEADLKERFFLFGYDQTNSGSIMIEHENRLIVANGENLYFSEKPVFEREEAISFKIDAVQILPSEIRSLSSLDEKIVAITENGIFSIIIPETGALQVRKVQSLENYKINKNSIVPFQHGVIFQTNYGITLLDRGLNLTFIGDDIKKHLADHSIVEGYVNESRQEIYLRTNDSNVNLIYNYLYNKWTTNETNLVSELESVSGETLRLDGTGRLLSDKIDGKLLVTSILKTGDIDISGAIQGFNRLLALTFLGEFRDFEYIRIEVFKDHLSTPEVNFEVTPEEAEKIFGSDIPLGDMDVPLGYEPPISTHFEVPMRIGRISSFSLRFTIRGSTTTKFSGLGVTGISESDRFFKEGRKYSATRATRV